MLYRENDLKSSLVYKVVYITDFDKNSKGKKIFINNSCGGKYQVATYMSNKFIFCAISTAISIGFMTSLGPNKITLQ